MKKNKERRVDKRKRIKKGVNKVWTSQRELKREKRKSYRKMS